MARRRGRQRRSQGDGGNRKSGIDRIEEDVLQNILERLPALSFASAACVCRSWNSLCNRVLNRPKLSSAFSLNDSLEVAVTEVVDKVLSEPLRPHFAIACISPLFCLHLAHELITGKLGSKIPVVTYESKGIIGRDAVTNEFEEVQWYIEDQEDPGTQVGSLFQNVISGILLTVGYLPGLKVDAVPLLQTTKDLDSRVPMVDKFVMDIREYTTSISGCTPPVGIIMFGDPAINMTSILEKMDYAMPLDTFIVGDECCRFRYRCQGNFGHTTQTGTRSSVAVALLFLRDRNKPHGIGDIEFHFALSTGLSPLGPKFKAATVRERRKESLTWLTARREQSHVILDGQTMLDDINDELTQHLADGIEYPVLYIGVTKRRKYSVGLEKVKWMTSLTFHEITGGDEEYLFVYGNDIKTGDFFRIYYSDPRFALSTCVNIRENFSHMKQDWDPGSLHGMTRADTNGVKKEAFGGFVFSCCGRGEGFFGCPGTDSSPLHGNFPEIPIAGTFCSGEIGRSSSRLYIGEAEEQGPAAQCCLHGYSTVYLLMTYTPAQPQH